MKYGKIVPAHMLGRPGVVQGLGVVGGMEVNYRRNDEMGITRMAREEKMRQRNARISEAVEAEMCCEMNRKINMKLT